MKLQCFLTFLDDRKITRQNFTSRIFLFGTSRNFEMRPGESPLEKTLLRSEIVVDGFFPAGIRRIDCREKQMKLNYWKIIENNQKFQCRSAEMLVQILPFRMGVQLKLIELPMDLIQPPILHELASKCPMLRYMTLGNKLSLSLSLRTKVYCL